MKKITLAFLLIASFVANAQTVANSQQGQQQQASSQASNAGNSQAITFISTAPTATTALITQNVTSNGTQTVNQNVSGSTTQNVNQTVAGSTTQNVNSAISGTQTQNVVYSGEQTIKNVPSVSGPNLVTSNDTCMGSTSGSVNIAGLGIGGGTSWVDGNCKMLKNSREMWNMGMKGAALALMCTDQANREALELTGFECPQTTQDKAINLKLTSSIVVPSDPTDPIVRARMGLPALK